MYETVRRTSSHHIPILHNFDVQLSLTNREEIIIHKKGFIYKGEHIVSDAVNIKLHELCQAFSMSSFVLPEKYSSIKPLIPGNCNGRCTISVYDNPHICDNKRFGSLFLHKNYFTGKCCNFNDYRCIPTDFMYPYLNLCNKISPVLIHAYVRILWSIGSQYIGYPRMTRITCALLVLSHIYMYGSFPSFYDLLPCTFLSST